MMGLEIFQMVLHHKDIYSFQQLLYVHFRAGLIT